MPVLAQKSVWIINAVIVLYSLLYFWSLLPEAVSVKKLYDTCVHIVYRTNDSQASLLLELAQD
jgi:hypothetical protein